MHFVCSTFGSAGDVFPMLGLALELRNRDHDVTFATNQHFEDLARSYDLPFEPLGTEEAYRACIDSPDLWHPQRGFPHVFKFLSPVLKQQYAIHAQLAGSGNVVGITNCFGFGALLAQEKLRVPAITVHLQPAVMWSDLDPPSLPGMFGPRWLKSLMFRIGEKFFIDPVVLPFLNGWRKELDLPPVKRICRWWNSPFGVLCMFPDWYSKPQADWPQNFVQTDFPLWNHQTSDQLPDDVESFLKRGEPPVVFTPGSANLHGSQFFSSAIEACRVMKRRGIMLTTFREQLPAHLPDEILHCSYVPLDLLLKRSAAFVHHGGVGSASQAMLAGIPQVLMPLAHDQFDNAARIKALKLGNSISADRFTSSRIVPMLQELLGSSAVTNACREVARRLAPRDGIRRSADAVECQIAGLRNDRSRLTN